MFGGVRVEASCAGVDGSTGHGSLARVRVDVNVRRRMVGRAHSSPRDAIYPSKLRNFLWLRLLEMRHQLGRVRERRDQKKENRFRI